MRIATKFSAMVLRSIATQSKDGKNTYYKLSLEDTVSGEAGTISCTEDVANSVQRFQQYICSAEFNTEYSSFRIVNVKPVPEKNEVKPSGK